MLDHDGGTFSLRISRIAAIVLVAASLGRLVDMSQSPEVEGGYFPAQISDEHAGAIALTAGENVPGMRRMLTRMLTGNRNVNPDFIYYSDALSSIRDMSPERELPTSISTARAVASRMSGAEQHLYLDEGPERGVPGLQVTHIDGKEASVEVWASSLRKRLAVVMSEGVQASSAMTSVLTLENGETVKVHYGAAMVARRALSSSRLAEVEALADPGQSLTSDRLYRVIPDVRLVAGPARTTYAHAKAPHNTDGPSAGLAYVISYLNAHASGGLLAGTTVAASGTIDARGNVGPVGGFPAKEMAAAHSGAEILFVPEGTARALRPSRLMAVVEVSSAQEAVSYLCTRTATEEVSSGSICAFAFALPTVAARIGPAAATISD